jgi:hypothetical protein
MQKRRQSACGASGNGDAMDWSISGSSCASLRLSVLVALGYLQPNDRDEPQKLLDAFYRFLDRQLG